MPGASLCQFGTWVEWLWLITVPFLIRTARAWPHPSPIHRFRSFSCSGHRLRCPVPILRPTPGPFIHTASARPHIVVACSASQNLKVRHEKLRFSTSGLF
eukprot:1160470-Pelagomonas_calceolata.AAC.8